MSRLSHHPRWEPLPAAERPGGLPELPPRPGHRARLPRGVRAAIVIAALALLVLLVPAQSSRAVGPTASGQQQPQVALAALLPERPGGTPPPPLSSLPDAPAEREGATTGRGGPLDCLSDPGECFNAMLTDMLQGFADTLRENLNRVLRSDLNVVTRTPERFTHDHPMVQQLWGVSRLIANQGLLLVLLVGALNIIVRPSLGVAYHEWAELIPRVIMGGLFINLSMEGASALIGINNALCDTFNDTTLLPGWAGAGEQEQALADILAVLTYLVTAFVLLFQMLLRLAVLDVLLIVMPLAALCWVLPQTQGLARTWSNLFTGVVLTQFVQVIALKLGVALFVEMGPDMASGGSVLLVNLIGVALLVLTIKIPALMRAQGAGDGLGLARFLVYRQFAAAIGGGRAGGSQGTPGGSSTGTRTAPPPGGNGGGTGGSGGAPRGMIAPYFGGGGGGGYTLHVYSSRPAPPSGGSTRALPPERPLALPAPRAGRDGDR